MAPPLRRCDELPGFEADDLAAAFVCFRLTAAAIVEGAPILRPARPAELDLHRACQAALDIAGSPSQARARQFFLDHFAAATVGDGPAFLTGYYEPVVDGALEAAPGFEAPLLARPADLRTFAADDPRPTWAAGLSAVREDAAGRLSPYPSRAAIEAEALRGAYRPLVWLRDWVEVFFIHVQGSARVRLPDGRMLRVTYAGRNGHPYTSIGRLVVDAGYLPLETMSLASFKAWLRGAGQAPGDLGRAILQRNASYIFFEAAVAEDERGPTGGAGVPLTAGRSIAVDRALWSYGLPFWIEADLPWQTPGPFRRLMIAQDTGSAILGSARADLFVGTGEAAGRIAGDIRHTGTMIPLRPTGRPGEPR